MYDILLTELTPVGFYEPASLRLVVQPQIHYMSAYHTKSCGQNDT